MGPVAQRPRRLKQSVAKRRGLSDIRNSRIPNITLRWTSNPKTC